MERKIHEFIIENLNNDEIFKDNAKRRTPKSSEIKDKILNELSEVIKNTYNADITPQKIRTIYNKHNYLIKNRFILF